ncbi:sensor histidine kinase [Fimbriiglobus ruber]|uniref:sensor histidine kinase n=1 Tax=Fimbriiglobus ruber TaxID=1908690 RepID=UPI00137A2589|nr:histidine kinase dimerization/phosphoacceptor domain -containing protein [Fimbriiglobus ruber]
MSRLFDPTGFPPRWHCGSWTPAHGWLHILSDASVCAAYFVIPCILTYYLLRQRGWPFRRIQLLFVAFILACGTTHLMEAVIFWWPAYRLAGVLKLLTALISWATVLALVRVTPEVLSLRSPQELEAEIAERKRVEDAFRTSEERFRHLVEGVEDYAIYMLDPAGNIASWNSGAERITGYSSEEVIGQHFSRFYLPEEIAIGHPLRELRAAVSEGRYEEEGRRVRKDGTVYWAVVTITPLNDREGRHVGFAKVIRNVSKRKAAAEQMEASLREKEVLLKEIHHRVKNNLQIISTLLDLQSDHTTDPQALAMFKESRGRVRSMALIHERLYRSQDMARVDFSGYVRQLADDLYRGYKAFGDIGLELDVNVPPLPIDVAIPCGLLLNELMSNCFKHAFADRQTGCIRVSLNQDDGKTNVLVVADDGPGFPAGVDFRDTTSFGLQLVNTLVRQLGGEIELITGRGTTFRVRFPDRK